MMRRHVADRFRSGRVLLAGDAAHLCSPIGGQGLNIGIGDATAWVPALVAVLRGHGGEDLLDAVAARRRSSPPGRTPDGVGRMGSGRRQFTDRRALSAVRDLVAPLGIRAGRPLVTRWLGGALDPG